jgi:hypothetical protein
LNPRCKDGEKVFADVTSMIYLRDKWKEFVDYYEKNERMKKKFREVK